MDCRDKPGNDSAEIGNAPKKALAMAQVSLRKVVKRFDDTEAVRGIDLDIADKEFVVLVGPSGCGKSTTLRMIAGLEEISAGEIAVDGEVVNDVPPKDRDMAMVFQNYALYPHMTVYENMSFGLRLKRYPKDEIARRVREAARILDITELLERKPRQLSGGQRQRVAMGRAIVRNPKVFLFDEPLSNLDAKLRVQMRTEIKRVHQKVRTTTVYVTHDQVEAMTLADRVVVMNGGRIEQIGSPNDVYHAPMTRFVAGFIGSPAMNFLPCRLEEAGGALAVRLSDEVVLPVPAARAQRYRSHAGRTGLTFGLRPEHLTEAKPNGERALGYIDAVIEVTEPLGMETLVFFRIGGIDVCGRVSPTAGAREGARMRLAASLDHMHLIDDATGRVI
jgi:multiple sugar transport system ATP-binding protein